MEPIIFEIMGEAVPWKAPLHGRLRGGRVVTYSPKHMKVWQDNARIVAMQAMRGKKILTGPVKLNIIISLVPPKSWPQWKREAAIAGKIAPTVPPDKTNILKCTEDALNGIVFLDDKQVVAGSQIKMYGIEPFVQIVAFPMNMSSAGVTRKEVNAVLEGIR